MVIQLFVLFYNVSLKSLCSFATLFLMYWWLYGGRRTRCMTTAVRVVLRSPHPLYGGRRTLTLTA